MDFGEYFLTGAFISILLVAAVAIFTIQNTNREFIRNGYVQKQVVSEYSTIWVKP